MRAEAIVFNGRYELVERNVVDVKLGEAVVKPIYTYLGVVEKILYSSYEPYVKPVVPGSAGVVRIIEDPGRGVLSGKTVVVSPISSRGILGLDADGLLVSYGGLDSAYVWSYVTDPKPYHAIQPYIAYGSTLGSLSNGSTLIVGCELASVSSALYIREAYGERPHILCNKPLKAIKYLGFKVFRDLGSLNNRYDTVIVDYERYSLIHTVLNSIEYRRLLVSVFSRLRQIPVKSGLNAKISYVDRVGEADPVIIGKITSVVKKYVKVVKMKSLEEIIGLLPPRGLGVVVEYEEA